MTISGNIVCVLKSAADKLASPAKRKFMAETAITLGRGSQRACEKQLGWCRNTIRKGIHEVEGGIDCIDNFAGRGRKKCEEHNPELLAHIKSIVDTNTESQADPAMNSERLYLKITSNQIRRQLQKIFHYREEQIPAESTVTRILNENNYYLRKVRKTIPKKRSQKQMLSLKIYQL